MMPAASYALESLTEQELGSVTAQAGFSNIGDVLGVKMDAENRTLTFGAVGSGDGAKGGLFSLTDMNYTGEINLAPNVASVSPDGTVTLDMSSVSVDIQDFSADIRLGEKAGAGASLGSLTIKQMNINMTGFVHVSAIP
jgi:hypothetical protein